MKPFFWSKIAGAKLHDTIWIKLDDSGIDIHRDELEGLFSKNKPKPKKAASAAASESKRPTKPKAVSYLDGKRQQNGGIALSKIHKTDTEIVDILYSCDLGVLNGEMIKMLQRVCPTREELAALKEHDRTQPNLIAPLDRFMIAMSDIPRVSFRLKCLEVVAQFDDKYKDTKASVSAITSAIKNLRSSTALTQILETVLAIGNYMNGSTSRGQCVGFKIDALSKLPNTRGSDGKTTLMMFLVKILEPEQLEVVELADACTDASKISMSQLDADIGMLKKQVNVVSNEMEKMKSAPPSGHTDSFTSVMAPFVTRCTEQIQQLTSASEDMHQSYNSLVQTYGEDPAKSGPDEFFKLWTTFFNQIEEACAANDRLAAAEAKANKKKAAKAGAPSSKFGGAPSPAARGARGPSGAVMGQLAAALAKRK